MGLVILYAALFALWLAIGIVTLKTPPVSSASYAAVWTLVLFYLLMDVVKALAPFVC